MVVHSGGLRGGGGALGSQNLSMTRAETEPSTDELLETGANEVRLVGRLGADAVSKTLPSGDVVVTFRVVTRRIPRARRPGAVGSEPGPQVDALDCVAWRADVRRSVTRWDAGDVVEVSGALRRRFWRTAAGPASRVEVEVTRARRLRRTV